MNRRGLVKNAIIIFLVIMLILTFFSNTIMNYSLPEVAAQYSQSGSITSKIRTTSTVKANATHKITIDESRKVLSVAVKEGQSVSKGDVLFYLEDAESTQLQTARETLASLEKQYKLKMLESGADYYSSELAIKQKQDEIKKAKDALEKVSGDSSVLETLEAEIKSLNSQLKQLNKELTAYNNKISQIKNLAADISLEGISTEERILTAVAELEVKKAAYDTATENKESTASALETAQAEYNKLSESYAAVSPSGATVAELEEQIAALEKTISRYKEDYKIAIQKIDDEIDEAYNEWVDADFRYNSALVLYNQGSGSYDAVEKWRAETETTKEKYDSLVATYSATKADKKLVYDRQMEDYNEDLEKLKTQLENVSGSQSLKDRLDAATKKKDSATVAASNAEEEYNKRKTEYTEAKNTYDSLVNLSKLEEYEAAVEKLDEEIEEITETLSEKNEEKAEIGSISDIEAQQEKIEALEQDLATLQHTLAKQKESDSLQDQRDQIEIDELLADIAEQQALVEKYEANSVDAKIVADIDGQISSLSVANGSETTMGQTMCEIVVTELGYYCEVNLTAEQAKRVRTGDTVTISNNWWSTVSGTIAALSNDPKNPGQSKIATINLTGDVTVGQSLSLTIGEKGQTYDAVVPNSAIREDNNGKFILAVEAKSSPLGNRYIAKRVDVTVLASDDTNSAVSGVMGGEFIITTSTKPISAGMQVRMAD